MPVVLLYFLCILRPLAAQRLEDKRQLGLWKYSIIIIRMDFMSFLNFLGGLSFDQIQRQDGEAAEEIQFHFGIRQSHSFRNAAEAHKETAVLHLLGNRQYLGHPHHHHRC